MAEIFKIFMVKAIANIVAKDCYVNTMSYVFYFFLCFDAYIIVNDKNFVFCCCIYFIVS